MPGILICIYTHKQIFHFRMTDSSKKINFNFKKADREKKKFIETIIKRLKELWSIYVPIFIHFHIFVYFAFLFLFSTCNVRFIGLSYIFAIFSTLRRDYFFGLLWSFSETGFEYHLVVCCYWYEFGTGFMYRKRYWGDLWWIFGVVLKLSFAEKFAHPIFFNSTKFGKTETTVWYN